MAAKAAPKLDLKEDPYKPLVAPSPDAVTRVDVPPPQFVMLDGAGDPNTSQA